MLSSVARSLARSTSTSLGRRSATTTAAAQQSHYQLTNASWNLAGDVSDPRMVHNHNVRSTKQMIQTQQQQHAAAPVFVGFAVPAFATAHSDTVAAPQSMLDSILMNVEEEHSITITASEEEEEGLQMKRNRNNRPAKRANKGKRPCNRNARRAKLIKLGRRSRS